MPTARSVQQTPPDPQGPAHAQTADPVEVFNIPGRLLEPRDAPIAEPA